MTYEELWDLADTEGLAIGAWDIGTDQWGEATEKIILRTQEVSCQAILKNLIYR